MNAIVPSGDRALYEADEHAWIERQIQALRSGRLHELDRDSLVEYLADMTIHDRRELASRFAVLLQHLLKIAFQPVRHSRGWNYTVVDLQQQIRRLLKSIPSLSAHQAALFADAYDDAVRLAAAETGMAVAAFPAASPWSVDAALSFVPPEPRLPASSDRRRGRD